MERSTRPLSEPGSGYGRRFAALFAAGALGVAAVVPSTVELIRSQLADAGAELPPGPVLALAAALQPLLLLAILVALGTRLAPRLGLRSHLAERAAGHPPRGEPLRRSLPLALALGAGAALALVALDALTLPSLGPAGAELAIIANRTPGGTVVGVLYGGVTEELMMRWGVVSCLAWIGAKLTGAGSAPPRAALMWTAIAIAALLFGAGHLPAVAAHGIALTGPVVARTVALNAVAGLVFGWLFWRRSLEAAMIAHATVHLAWSALALV